MGYLTNFIVYTLAMVGVIGIAIMVFKFSSCSNLKGNSSQLKVQDSLTIAPRKTLYIISAGTEKFLIAGDVDKTTLISKLEKAHESDILASKKEYESFSTEKFEEVLRVPRKKDYLDRKGLGIQRKEEKPYHSVMKNLAERIKMGE